MGDDFNWDWFIHNIWERENVAGLKGIEGKGGYYNGRYHPYQATNGIDVGPGFDMKHQSEAFRKKAYSTGFTKEELDDSLREQTKPELEAIDRKIRELGGNPSRVTNEVKAGLLDIYHQRNKGLYSEFPNLWDAVVKGDYEGMQRESRTTYKDRKGNKHTDNGRWEYRKNTYFKTPEAQRPTLGDFSIPSHVEAPDALRVQRPTIAMPVKKKAYGGELSSHWDSLSQKEKAEMIRVAIQNGITTLSDIKQAYNEFAKGGPLKNWTMEDEAGYRHWKQSLPKNLRDTNDDDYDMRAAYKAGAKPMWNDEDKSYHLSSRDPETGRIFKAPHHPTYLKALGEDAKFGYYPTIDSDGNTYTETWRGNTQYPREIEVPYRAYGGNLFYKGGKKNSSSSITTQRAMDYLMSKGMSRTGAAAIVGTLQAESRLDPTIHAKMKGDDGEGLAQWTGSRKNNFWKVLEGIDPDARRKYGSISNVPFERQMDVVLAERPDVMQAISNARDISAATDIMLRGFENGGGTIGTLATKEQMDKIYGKWNNGYDKQMTKRLGNANSILGITAPPYEIPQTFFDNINAQIAIPQAGLQQSTADIDPEFRYKQPVIDETMFQPKSIEDAVMKSIEEEDKQNRLQKINTFNTIMGLMGQTAPLTGLGNTDTPQGLLDYVGQIYS